jgi:hypothetical protein
MLLNDLLEAFGPKRKDIFWLQQVALGFDFVDDVEIMTGAQTGSTFLRNTSYVLLIKFKNGAEKLERIPEYVNFNDPHTKDYYEHSWTETLERYMKKHKPGGRTDMAKKLIAACRAKYKLGLVLKRETGNHVAYAGKIYKTMQEARDDRQVFNRVNHFAGNYVKFDVFVPRGSTTCDITLHHYNENRHQRVEVVPTVEEALKIIEDMLNAAA